MKMKYKFLYKNGHEDEVIQEATEQEFEKMNNLITTSFFHGREGYLSVGDGDKKGSFIRLSDISRVEVESLTEETTE